MGTIYFTTENEVDKVMPNMQIHLMDNDQTNSDDDLGQAVTDGQGHFAVVGEEDEEEEQQPYLRITMSYCDSVLKVCERFRPYDIEVIDRNWRSRLEFFPRRPFFTLWNFYIP
jgi:hypothetical protein